MFLMITENYREIQEADQKVRFAPEGVAPQATTIHHIAPDNDDKIPWLEAMALER